MADNVSQEEKVNALLMKVTDSIKILDKRLETLADKESDMMARTLQIREIPSVTKTAVGEALSVSVPQFSQAVVEKMIGDVNRQVDDVQSKMNRLTHAITESTGRLMTLNFWTRKTVLIVLAVTFFTAFSGSFLASSYMMIRNPGLYMSILRYMDTANRIDENRAQRMQGR